MVGDCGALLGWGSSLVCGVRGRGFSLLRKVKRAVEEAPAWEPGDPLVALVPLLCVAGEALTSSGFQSLTSKMRGLDSEPMYPLGAQKYLNFLFSQKKSSELLG